MLDKIGRKDQNRFMFEYAISKMVEGTRLKDLREHITILEGKM